MRVAPDNTVTVLVKHLDKGQGIATGLSTLVAEELDADWKQMRAEFAPADASKYNNLLFGPLQATGGSSSIANSFLQYRQAGAVARAMLIAAAAAAWGVPASEIVVAKGVLSHKSGKSGALRRLRRGGIETRGPEGRAAQERLRLRLIGKTFKRLDTEAKITGQPIYTQDVHLDGMVVVSVVHPPRFGGVAKSIDASAAQPVKGFLDAKIIPQGVAVYATSTWPAFKAKGVVKVEWDDEKAEKRGSAELLAEYRKLADQQAGGRTQRRRRRRRAGVRGARSSRRSSPSRILAHAAMEPMNARRQVRRRHCPTSGPVAVARQSIRPSPARSSASRPTRCASTRKYAGGSFGRRAMPNADYLAEAAMAAKALG